MENQLNTTSDKSMQKKMSTDEVKERLRAAMSPCEPEYILQRVGEILSGDAHRTSELSKEEHILIENAFLMVGHERHHLVAESIVDERWRSMVMDLASSIQNEYCCVMSSEIALAGLAASAYYRSLRAARRMNAMLDKQEIGSIGVNFIGQVGKEIDRAERQYLCAIETLRSRRQPQVNVKVQAKTAFFGNQTINAQSSSAQYENNDLQ